MKSIRITIILLCSSLNLFAQCSLYQAGRLTQYNLGSVVCIDGRSKKCVCDSEVKPGQKCLSANWQVQKSPDGRELNCELKPIGVNNINNVTVSSPSPKQPVTLPWYRPPNPKLYELQRGMFAYKTSSGLEACRPINAVAHANFDCYDFDYFTFFSEEGYQGSYYKARLEIGGQLDFDRIGFYCQSVIVPSRLKDRFLLYCSYNKSYIPTTDLYRYMDIPYDQINRVNYSQLLQYQDPRAKFLPLDKSRPDNFTFGSFKVLPNPDYDNTLYAYEFTVFRGDRQAVKLNNEVWESIMNANKKGANSLLIPKGYQVEIYSENSSSPIATYIARDESLKLRELFENNDPQLKRILKFNKIRILPIAH